MVGVPGEAYTHQVPHFTFGPDCAGVDGRQAGGGRLTAIVEWTDDHQVLLACIGAQLVDGVKAAVAHGEFGAIHGGNVDQRLVTQIWVPFGEFGQRHKLIWLDIDDLLSMMQPGSKDRIAETFDEAGGVFAFAGGQRCNGWNARSPSSSGIC